MKLSVVIPCFNHSEKLSSIIDRLVALDLPIIIVDDASDQKHASSIDKIIEADHKRVYLLRHQENQGKGGAVMSGLLYAESLGFTHSLQIDADGQHDITDVEKFIAKSINNPNALISGRPIYDESIPKSRLYGRYITHFWVSIETLSLKVMDTMCGFRVYPLKETNALISSSKLGKRMDFDIEIMVRLSWQNVAMEFIPTRVNYPEDGKSHFRPLEDNLKISWLHTRLFFGMLVRLPKLLWFKLCR